MSPITLLRGNAATDPSIVASGGDQQFNVVTRYGAVGDGLADDTAAIQSAIDAANAAYVASLIPFTAGTQQVVYFPTGRYHVPCVNGQSQWNANPNVGRYYALEHKAGVVLRGDKTATISSPYGSSEEPDGDGIFYETIVFVEDGGNADNWAIRGLNFTQETFAVGNERPTSAVILASCDNWAIEDCVFDGLPGAVIVAGPDATADTPGISRFHIDRNVATNVAGQFVTMYGKASAPTKLWTINNNRCENALTGAECIAAAASLFEDGEVCGNYIFNWGPITVGGDRLRINGNTVISHYDDGSGGGGGIGLHGGARVEVVGNHVDTSPFSSAIPGIGNNFSCFEAVEDGTSDVRVEGNTFITGYSPAIVTQTNDEHADVRIVNNRIVTTDAAMGGDGVALQFRALRRFAIEGNTLDGSGVANIALAISGGSHEGRICDNTFLNRGAGEGYSISAVDGCYIRGNKGTFVSSVGSDSIVCDNRLTSDAIATGAVNITVDASRVTIKGNILENTGVGTKVLVQLDGSSTTSDYIYVLDNIPVGTPLGFGGSDGINIAAAGSHKLVRAL